MQQDDQEASLLSSFLNIFQFLLFKLLLFSDIEGYRRHELEVSHIIFRIITEEKET